VRRDQLEHVIAAAAANIVEADEFVVIGSQAILGSLPEPPQELLQSMEADIDPARDPGRAADVDGAIGDGSQFHRTFGYYAHGVGPETAKAPEGWQDRLIRVDVPPRPLSHRQPVAFCLEVHDLVLAKCVAGRDRDWDYARGTIHHEIVDPDELLRRVALLPIDSARRDYIRTMLGGLIGGK
jgi:hypothetical protein